MTTVNLMHDAYRHLTGKSDIQNIMKVFGKGGYVTPGFSNATMRQPVKGKPHIAFIGGLWRVSKVQKPYWKYALLWQDAHAFTYELNRLKFFEYYEKVLNEREAAKKGITGD